MKKNYEIADEIELDQKNLYFVPLGGSEQFGVNFNMYAFNGKWLVIDCGIGFADDRFPGVDILLPDIEYAVDQKDDIAGMVITHAHEDHVGAVAHLWPYLECPIYCTEFTAAILKRKFSEAEGCDHAKITIIKAGQNQKIGPFSLDFLHVAHSIPQTVAVGIKTKAGNVLHSGDWNLDPAPVLSKPTDEEAFKAFGKQGVLAYIGDSTNSDVPGRAGSESDVESGLAQLFKEQKGRIVITIFASNVGRIRSIAKAAEATGRSVAIVGRSLHSMTAAGISCGYLGDIPDFVDIDDIGYVPQDKQVLILTGSQGEARAALARAARGENRDVKLGANDTVVFSSRAIPGNEKEINHVKNNLVASGVKIITPRDTNYTIHVSGHPCQDEITDMFNWLKPHIVVPVHGERTQLEAHANLARASQVKNVIVPNNGSVICLGPSKAEIVGHVHTGILAVESRRIIRGDHKSLSERRKLQYAGSVHATIVLDDRGDLIAEPQVTMMGLIDTEEEEGFDFEQETLDEIEDTLGDLSKRDKKDDAKVKEEIRVAIRRYINYKLGMKPLVAVHVARV